MPALAAADKMVNVDKIRKTQNIHKQGTGLHMCLMAAADLPTWLGLQASLT
jgi:hypothetical protein